MQFYHPERVSANQSLRIPIADATYRLSKSIDELQISGLEAHPLTRSAFDRGYDHQSVFIFLDGNPQTRRRLEDAGCEVLTYRGVELSLKAEGGPTCLTRPIFRSG